MGQFYFGDLSRRWVKIGPALTTAADRLVSIPLEKVRMTTGTVLMREWHGKKNQVTVLEDGFLYRTKRFRSLSQVARLITGARWSGPLFFGLKSPRKEQLNEAA